MLRVLLLQLPIPQMTFGIRTANVPMAAACLKQSLAADFPARVEILAESVVSYIGDKALIQRVMESAPDVVGFSVFNWNLSRSIYIAGKLKEQIPVAVVFGGPEVTPDNPALSTDAADYLVYGEGEPVFGQILEKISDTHNKDRFKRLAQKDIHKKPVTFGPVPHAGFSSQASPYLKGLLEPEVDGLVYLESQRGCPYRCGFCYYNKARGKIAPADPQNIARAAAWAKDEGISEICMIDPSVNTRPDLIHLLHRFSDINADKRLSFTGEIRAESITPEMADGFAAAGFTGFEIGLQTVSKAALSVMNRNTDLKRFLEGTRLLRERGIVPRIDLIVGLPGDDPEGFRKSVMFVKDHDLADDIQVFPLSVLPGTDFRARSDELGLCFDPFPPYLVRQTPGFSGDDMYRSIEFAESRLDISLFPAPCLDIAFRQKTVSGPGDADVQVAIGGRNIVKTLVLNSFRSIDDLSQTAGRLASPYQIHVGPTLVDAAYLCRVIGMLTSENPLTPFELIFAGHKSAPDIRRLLQAVRLFRPGYLDAYDTYRYRTPGNRSVLFTWLTRLRDVSFEGEMRRQVFWWEASRLPGVSDLEALSGFDGVLVDTPLTDKEIMGWQDRMAGAAHDLMQVCFSDVRLQKRWLGLTAEDVFNKMFVSQS